ncbi:MAG: formyltransferase family protein, partial [Rhodospirillales bacterium]|nr:formyltransferase family protein [Rhodospirillales bacterium]
ALWDLLRTEGVDVAIQGGIGILKPDMIEVPRLCFLNVHPGKLPEYRGNSCPEWSLYNGDGVWATAHVIDAGIDTGPVITMRKFDFPDGWDYRTLRANIYGHCTTVLVEALSLLDGLGDRPLDTVAKPQDEALAHYWEPIPDDKMAELKRRLVTKGQAS